LPSGDAVPPLESAPSNPPPAGHKKQALLPAASEEGPTAPQPASSVGAPPPEDDKASALDTSSPMSYVWLVLVGAGGAGIVALAVYMNRSCSGGRDSKKEPTGGDVEMAAAPDAGDDRSQSQSLSQPLNWNKTPRQTYPCMAAWETGFPQLPSAVTSTVVHPLGILLNPCPGNDATFPWASKVFVARLSPLGGFPLEYGSFRDDASSAQRRVPTRRLMRCWLW
jgi:hypothetical protein